MSCDFAVPNQYIKMCTEARKACHANGREFQCRCGTRFTTITRSGNEVMGKMPLFDGDRLLCLPCVDENKLKNFSTYKQLGVHILDLYTAYLDDDHETDISGAITTQLEMFSFD